MATELQALRSKLQVLSSNCSQLSAQLQELTSDIDAFTQTASDESTVTDSEAEEIILNLIADLKQVARHNVSVRRIFL